MNKFLLLLCTITVLRCSLAFASNQNESLELPSEPPICCLNLINDIQVGYDPIKISSHLKVQADLYNTAGQHYFTYDNECIKVNESGLYRISLFQVLTADVDSRVYTQLIMSEAPLCVHALNVNAKAMDQIQFSQIVRLNKGDTFIVASCTGEGDKVRLSGGGPSVSKLTIEALNQSGPYISK